VQEEQDLEAGREEEEEEEDRRWNQHPLQMTPILLWLWNLFPKGMLSVPIFNISLTQL
jgi:hypothetical protein